MLTPSPESTRLPACKRASGPFTRPATASEDTNEHKANPRHP